MKQTKKPETLLSRGVAEVVIKKDLEKLLDSRKKITVYFGIDPTSTTIHLGNAIPLRKLRDFQRAGHHVIFLVGSFTAMIGDTSDKDAMRKPMTEKEIRSNFKTYTKQASKILNMNKTKVVYNDHWLSKLTFKEVAELTQHFTVQQMIERDRYQERLKKNKPIGLHEFLYPLMQGYDSVHLEVDLEIGGTDQLFNMLAGRTLLKAMKNKEKHVLTTPLLEGLDGRKMSKSYGNTVNLLDSADDMYGKIMSLDDSLITKYFELCTDLDEGAITDIQTGLKQGNNPRDAKAHLAFEIVTLYHSKRAAIQAQDNFVNVFRKKNAPDDIATKALKAGEWKIDEALTALGLASSKSEAKRLVEQGGVRVNSGVVADWKKTVPLKRGDVVQVGKRHFIKIK